MLRTATRPRWLALLVLALVLAWIAVLLGRWQLRVAHDVARAEVVQEAGERPARPIAEVVRPHEAFPDDGSGQRVIATGRYAPDEQLRVTGRLLDGRDGAWVVDRFVVDQTRANLPVVRGWVPKGASLPGPPSGEVALVGSLAPGEAPDESGRLAQGESTSVDLAQLVNLWPGELYNAFAFATDEEAGGREITDPPGLTRVPPPLPDTSLNWRNLMYAVQWWCFGGFAIWMWTKMVRQAAREEKETDQMSEHDDD